MEYTYNIVDSLHTILGVSVHEDATIISKELLTTALTLEVPRYVPVDSLFNVTSEAPYNDCKFMILLDESKTTFDRDRPALVRVYA